MPGRCILHNTTGSCCCFDRFVLSGTLSPEGKCDTSGRAPVSPSHRRSPHEKVPRWKTKGQPLRYHASEVRVSPTRRVAHDFEEPCRDRPKFVGSSRPFPRRARQSYPASAPLNLHRDRRVVALPRYLPTLSSVSLMTSRSWPLTSRSNTCRSVTHRSAAICRTVVTVRRITRMGSLGEL